MCWILGLLPGERRHRQLRLPCCGGTRQKVRIPIGNAHTIDFRSLRAVYGLIIGAYLELRFVNVSLGTCPSEGHLPHVALCC